MSGIKTWTSFKAMLWTDSESALKRIKRHTSLTPFSIKTAVSKEYPLLQEIRQISQQLPDDLHIKWVESHQGKSKKIEVRLNKEADEYADK